MTQKSVWAAKFPRIFCRRKRTWKLVTLKHCTPLTVILIGLNKGIWQLWLWVNFFDALLYIKIFPDYCCVWFSHFIPMEKISEVTGKITSLTKQKKMMNGFYSCHSDSFGYRLSFVCVRARAPLSQSSLVTILWK